MREIVADEKHHLYDTWKWIIKNYTVSKMVCDRWLDFKNFIQDVGQKPGPKFRFHRHYFDKPYGPGNWRWREFVNTDESRKKRAAYARQYRARKMSEDPHFHRNWSLKRKFGINSDQYKKMLEFQNSLCAICKEVERTKANSNRVQQFGVDHCHKTGKIRGLLCSQCNTALGSFRDNEVFLQAAISYLRSHLT